MQIPPWLSDALDECVSGIAQSALVDAYAAMSRAYRLGDSVASGLPPRTFWAAYCAARFPATFAATLEALQHAPELPPSREVSVLDIGAGPGGAALAALERYPCVNRIVSLDSDRHALEIGGALLAGSPWAQSAQRSVVAGSCLEALPGCAPADLTVMSYVLSEIGDESRRALVEQAWARTQSVLVVVEPGTPENFAVVRECRERLVALGAHVAAPCPHAGTCPIVAPDWCHFSVRLARSRLHRAVKHSDLGHEDEKFSYLIASRASPAPVGGRILRHPGMRKGHVELVLCTPGGISRQTMSRRDRAPFKAARKAHWGDAWPHRPET